MSSTASTFYLAEARRNLLNRNYGRAYAFYLLVLKISMHHQQIIADDFGAAWREWSMELCSLKKTKDLFLLYEQGCELFMESDMLHYYMGCCLYKLDMKLEAVNMFRKALLANKHCFEAMISLENTCRGLVDSWHFFMLNDMNRNRHFEVAIRNVLHELDFKDTVLDIGSGSGILSMLAIKHGANKVHACESSKVMHSIAKECVINNSMESRIELANCDSLELSVKTSSVNVNILPNKATLVITETVDAGLLGEGIMNTLNHAWKNLLIPPEQGGIVIPYSASVYCSVVESDKISKKHNCFGLNSFNNMILKSGVGHRSVFAPTNFPSVSTCDLEPYTSEKMCKISHTVLSDSHNLIDVNFNNPTEVENIAEGKHGNVIADINIICNGYADAVVLWFQLDLESPENEPNSIGTETGSNYCWDQAVYPIREFVVENGNCSASRLKVAHNMVLRLHFGVDCDCFTLKLVDVMEKVGILGNSCPQNIAEFVRGKHLNSQKFISLSIPEEQIERINDQNYYNPYFRTISTLSKENRKLILDISNGFDLLTLRYKHMLAEKVTIHKVCQTDEIANAFSIICDQFGLDLHIHKTIPNLKFDVIMSDIIEPSGLLSLNAIGNMVKARAFLSENGTFIPAKMNLIAQCITSNELMEKCLITSDENTMGLKISDHMNDFRVSVHSDLDIETLQYSSLTEPEEVLCLDFINSQSSLLNHKKSVVSNILSSNTLHAVLFWFEIQLSDEILVTKDNNNHWKQAAYIFPSNKQFNMVKGDEIVLNTVCQNDSIIFNVSTYGC